MSLELVKGLMILVRLMSLPLPPTLWRMCLFAKSFSKMLDIERHVALEISMIEAGDPDATLTLGDAQRQHELAIDDVVECQENLESAELLAEDST